MVTDARGAVAGTLGVAVALLAGCAAVRQIGPPRLPQLEQATEAVQNPGDRLNAHQACSEASKAIEEMVACMQKAGYDFLPRSPESAAAECWRLRDDATYGGGRLPETFCFRRAQPPSP
jgi:hypothetical protein